MILSIKYIHWVIKRKTYNFFRKYEIPKMNNTGTIIRLGARRSEGSEGKISQI